MVSLKYFITVAFALSSVAGMAQNTLTLDSCINQANRHFAFDQQISFENQKTELGQKEIGKNYLPSLELNAMATWQNEQISIPVAFPGIEAPAAPLNINNVLFTLRQWIYDGSMSHNQKAIQENAGQVAVQQVEVQRLELKTKITQIYFSILLQEKQQTILAAKREVLAKRLEEIKTAVENGVLLPSDQQLLQAEAVQLKQAIAGIEFGKKESVAALEKLMGISISPSTNFVAPSAEISTDASLDNRPDVMLINYNMDLLDAQKDLTKSSYLPRLGVFADGGAGLPGYNIFSDGVSPMFRVGVSLNWKIFDWSKGNVQWQQISVNQQILAVQKERLKSQVNAQTAAQLNNIEKAKTLMQDDEELVALYNAVAEAYAAQLENGTITSAEYITQLNKAQEAQTQLELHKLQLLVAKMNYNNLLGK